MATGSFMTPIYSRSQSEIQGDLHKCIMQWVPAHVGMSENETADVLAKEIRKLNSDKLPFVVTVNDIEVYIQRKSKNQISELLIPNKTSSNQTQNTPPERDEEGTRTYLKWRNCPDT
ncbi:hypothetical protein TNCV_1215871 [Trichonephila clavipes]|nr:hypothetical protein TNCV_1215871 [Trichonephila clavipes]